MWIRNLHLDDFGCFTGARMDDLADGLIVIGGPQRAGKTTFMQAIRKLGYGITKGDSIPPATDSYRISANIQNKSSRLQLSIDGFAAPRLIDMDGKTNPTIDDLYGSLSKQQYHQLCTISLDELQSLPRGVNDHRELSAILLGAGYADIAQIPKLKAEFSKEAKKIGGKNGGAHYGLKPPIERIRDGIKKRDQANQQVEEYHEKRNELKTIVDQLEANNHSKDRLESEQERLRVVKNHFEDVREYQRLKQELNETDRSRIESLPANSIQQATHLKEQYLEVNNEVETATDEFERISNAHSSERMEALLAVESDLRDANREISGWRAKVEDIQTDTKKYQEKRQELENKVKTLRPDWDADIEHLATIPSDILSRERVREAVATYQKAQEDVEDTRDELERKQATVKSLESNLKQTEENDDREDVQQALKRFGLIVGVGLILGLALSLVNGIIGILIVALFIAGGLYDLSRNLQNVSGDDAPRREIKAQTQTIEADIAALKEELEAATTDLESSKGELEEVRSTLGLSAKVSPPTVETFYEQVAHLQEEVTTLKRQETNLEDRRNKLLSELQAVVELLGTVLEGFEMCDITLDDAEILFAEIETATDELQEAKNLHNAQSERDDIQDDVLDLFAEWDEAPSISANAAPNQVVQALATYIETAEAVLNLGEQWKRFRDLKRTLQTSFETQAVTDAFEPFCSDQDVDGWELSAIETVVDEFIDVDSVVSRLDEIDREFKTLDEQRSELLEERADVKAKMESLASDDDLVAAQDQIQRGRSELRPLAERYGMLRIAEYLLGEVHEQFIEQATGPLLTEASEIFSRITDDYDKVSHTGSLDELAFTAQRTDGVKQLSGELSRATAEQLFLAVRLARIRQLDSNVPIVLDDSMANFDPQHLARTVALIDEMATTNQVFLTTCHPEVIDCFEANADVSQYWWLTDGRFEGPYQNSNPIMIGFDAVQTSFTADQG